MKKDFQPIIDYVECRMSVTEFQRLFNTDKSLRKVLRTRICTSWYTYLKDYNYNLQELFENHYDYKNKSWDTIVNRAGIQGYLILFLDDLHIEYNKYEKYDDDYKFLLKIQPDWIDCNNNSILQKVIDSIPKELSQTQRIKIGKEKVRALFKYDKTYPRWIQNPEWPIVNDKPLVFSRQEKAKDGDIRTYYYFYDEDTKEQMVIEQFD